MDVDTCARMAEANKCGRQEVPVRTRVMGLTGGEHKSDNAARVLGRGLHSSVSVALTKGQLRGERAHFSPQFTSQFIMRTSSRNMQLVTSERNEHMHARLLTCSVSSFPYTGKDPFT